MKKLNWSKLRDRDLLKSQAYVNGIWCDAADRRTLEVINPATLQVIGNVPNMGQLETRQAIDGASCAWSEWKRWTGHQRAAVLRRWFELILQNTDDLAWILTAEQGKPLFEAIGEIRYAASFVEWFAEQSKRVTGEVLSAPTADKRMFVIKQPVGVSAAITPWNFPAAMITRKVAPALAAGCTMIVKPSEFTPLTALALGELAERAGVPNGVLQFVTGEPIAIGKELTSNPMVRKLSFTGSTKVGRLLAQQCSSTVKRISLELGGQAPFIVFEDADVDSAVAGAVASKYRNSGQTCVCSNRFYIQAALYEQFAEKLVAATNRLRVGPGVNSASELGPLINAAAVAKVEQHVDDALTKGATLLAGGERHELGGNFYQPTVLGNVTSSMMVACEETFGPVSPLLVFTDEAEVIQLANSTEFGLAAYLYSRDIDRVWRVAESLEFGMVGVNTGVISNEVAPFGGIKQSGMGREGGQAGIEEYLEMKYICLGGVI